MSDIRFNQWLHNSGTGGVSQVDGGHVGIGTTNPEIAVHSGNNKILNVGIVTASSYYGDGSNLSGIVGGGTSLSFNDNIGAYFGNSQDLKIHHDGNHSYIDDQGTGNLRLRSGTLEILNLAGNKTSAIFSSGGAQTLNFNNNTKFATQTNGITVTGGVYSDGLICGDSDQIELGDSGDLSIYHNGSNGYIKNSTGQQLYRSATHTFENAAGSSEYLRITSGGYVGVGENSPATILHVKANVGDMLRLDRNNTGAVGNQISFRHSASGTLTETGSINCVSTANAAAGELRFYTKASGASNAEKLRITSTGQLNLGGDFAQTTHLLYLSSTADAGIHIRADSDNVNENHNPYISMAQDGSNNQLFKMGIIGSAGSEFAQSIGNSPFIHAGNNDAQPLILAHQDDMVAILSNTEQSHFHSLSGISVGGLKIAHRGNDTGAALLLQGHNNTGTPGQATNTQLTHDGGSLEFEITHAGSRGLNIGSTRRIRVPGVWGVNGSSMRTVQIESDGNLCAPSSIREAKINIESISDVSWLYDFNPVTFNFRTKTEVNGENVWGDEADDGGLQYGLIADEVEAVNQHLCFYDDNKLSGVHYDRMVAPLIKALQDQKKEIDALKAKVSALEGS